MKDTVYSVADCSCVSHAAVFGLEDSIRRAKYPMSTNTDSVTFELTPGIVKLAQSPRGEGHDNWLKGVIVQFDLTFSNKAWVEAERYHWLDFVSSQSTMHRITKFDLDQAYNRYVDKEIIEVMKRRVKEYNELLEAKKSMEHDQNSDESICEYIANKLEEMYLIIVYSNPAGFRLTAGMTTNYLQLKTIYGQRRTHRLPEWREFCRWIETLPHAELITGKESKEEAR